MIAYFQHLASSHKMVRHEPNGNSHFSSLTEEAQNLYARKMHYPCVVFNPGDIEFSGSSSVTSIEREISLFFLDHCKDTGNYDRIREIYDTTEQIMKDFMQRMVRDRQNGVKVMSRFNPSICQAVQVYLESAGLYGWVLAFNITEPFYSVDCNQAFDDE